MRIYLVRHGSAYTNEDDSERHLNSEGIDQCHLTGKALRRLDIDFDLILSSPKARALQTAEIIAEEVGYQKDEIMITETLMPMASTNDTLSYLNNLKDKESVMLAGHLPLLENLASELISKTAKISLHFEAGAVCQIEAEQPFSRIGDFQWFLSPEHLRLIAQ